jgi:hypothetical protein
MSVASPILTFTGRNEPGVLKMRTCSRDPVLACRTVWNENSVGSEGGPTKYRKLARTFTAGSIVALVAILAFPSAQHAQSVPSSETEKAQAPARPPDLSGFWMPKFGGDVGLESWDPSDSQGKKPDQLPMTPWGLAKLKAARPPFGANETFENTNDPVQKYCNTPGITRIYLNPWQFTILQASNVVYILYEFTRVWRSIAMDRGHPKELDSTWLGDSIGRYEGDTLVIDTIGLNDETWLDRVGHPHSDALHFTERFRRVDHDTLELDVTFDDPKAYTRTWSSKKSFQLSSSPMAEMLCSLSETEAFRKKVIEPTTVEPHGK